MRSLPLLFLLPLIGCTAPVQAPSLAPRAAEAIDPRLPVETAAPSAPVSPALVARLTVLVEQARSGDVAFRAAAEAAEPLVAAAGAPQSESWVVAQQALSVAQAARAPTTRALGDIDEIAAVAIAGSGGLAPADLAAIQTAAAEVGAMSRRQAEAVKALQARLGG